ncbi:MAG TPA: hypothetical protein VJY41_08680 [Prolixibacteraceae bacterium]|nr:hypothetical protein [Prolixibacteraceae bacterium]
MSNYLFVLNNKKRVNAKMLVVIFSLIVVATLRGYGQFAIDSANSELYQQALAQCSTANTKNVGSNISIIANFSDSQNNTNFFNNGLIYFPIGNFKISNVEEDNCLELLLINHSAKVYVKHMPIVGAFNLY